MTYDRVIPDLAECIRLAEEARRKRPLLLVPPDFDPGEQVRALIAAGAVEMEAHPFLPPGQVVLTTVGMLEPDDGPWSLRPLLDAALGAQRTP
jgi:hypothetical protein